MAMCEMCGTAGYEPRQIYIDADSKTFVGPCCTSKVQHLLPLAGQVHVLPAPDESAEYGVEVSNKVGVRAYLNYGGLAITFERTPRQIRTWAEKQGLVDVRQAG